jgi:hypothetical protein
MANRAVKRNIQTLQNELALMQGQIVFTGPYGGVGSSIAVNSLTGSLATVLSGSSPNQFTSQFTVKYVSSGSYAINLANVWPKLLSVQLTPGVNGTASDVSWDVLQNTATAPRSDTTGSAGINQLGILLVKSGSTVADPLAGESVTVNIALALANSSV